MAPKFLSTKKMAEYLGYHPDFLRKNIGLLFFEGEHFFKPSKARNLRWDVEKMTAWVKGERISKVSKTILNNLLT